MGMVKDLMIRYCEAKHPDDFEKQDALFSQLMHGEPDLKEIARFLEKLEEEKWKPLKD